MFSVHFNSHKEFAIIIGGCDNHFDRNMSNICEYFDIKNRKWHAFASLNYGREGSGVMETENKMYVFAGHDMNH